MKKNNILIISVTSCMLILGFYIWRFSPFLPHINRNNDGSFTYKNITYSEYNKIDFVDKYGHLERGKKVAVINKKGDLPRCSVYEAKGDGSNGILIVYEEIVMSTDTYYHELN